MEWYAEYYKVDWPHSDDEVSAQVSAVRDADAGEQAVYTLQGMKVGTTASLHLLPQGIYVAGGKKFVVK